MLFFPIPTSLKKRSLVRSFVCLFGSAFIFSISLSLLLSLLSFPFLLWVDLWHPRVPRDVCHKLQSNLVTMLAFFPCLFMTFFFFHFFLLFLFFPSRSGAPDVKQPRYGSFRFPFFCLVRKQMCVSLSLRLTVCPPPILLSRCLKTSGLWPLTSRTQVTLFCLALAGLTWWNACVQNAQTLVLWSFSLFGNGLALDLLCASALMDLTVCSNGFLMFYITSVYWLQHFNNMIVLSSFTVPRVDFNFWEMVFTESRCCLVCSVHQNMENFRFRRTRGRVNDDRMMVFDCLD